MTEKQSFDELVALAMEQPGRATMRPVVEKELLHYDIFRALDTAGLLKNLVFQGGTSLRLCRGSNRFSEDLDFAGGKDFTADHMKEIKTCIEKHIGERYGLMVDVKEPKNTSFQSVKVDKWTVVVETAPEKSDLPRQRIKIEIANIPAYTRELVPLRQNYEFIKGNGLILVNAETLAEVMADKVLAFPASTKNIRYRDIWDLAWLAQQGAELDPTLVEQKIADYKVDDYPVLLDKAIDLLPTFVHSKEFHDQMLRFIDADTITQTLEKDGFKAYLVSTINGLFKEMRDHLSSGSADKRSPFKM